MGSVQPQLLEEVQRLEKQLAELRGRLVGSVERESLPEGSMPLLVFRLGKERVAILQSFVVEVVMMCRLTPLPEAAGWIPGILNCRGESVVVIDTLARLERVARKPEVSDLIVIVELEGRRVGLIVQEILGVETANREALQSPSNALELACYLLGVLQAEKTTLLFSVAALLGTSGLPAIAS